MTETVKRTATVREPGHKGTGDSCEPPHYCLHAHMAAYRTPAERRAPELVEALRDATDNLQGSALLHRGNH